MQFQHWAEPYAFEHWATEPNLMHFQDWAEPHTFEHWTTEPNLMQFQHLAKPYASDHLQQNLTNQYSNIGRQEKLTTFTSPLQQKFHFCSTDSPVILSILIPPSLLPSLLGWREGKEGKKDKLTSFTSTLQRGAIYKWLPQYVLNLDFSTMSLSYPQSNSSLCLILDYPFSPSMHTSYKHGPLVVFCHSSCICLAREISNGNNTEITVGNRLCTETRTKTEHGNNGARRESGGK